MNDTKLKSRSKNLFQTKPMQIVSLIFPIVLIVALYLLRDVLLLIGRHLWPCTFYSLTGIYCPGCGNTRSVICLLHGDILGSLRYNIIPVTLIIFTMLAYAEYLTYSFERHKKIFPRSYIFWTIFGIMLAVYFVGRNFIPYLVP